MASPFFYDFAVSGGGVGNSDVIDVGDCDGMRLQVTGTFVATLQVQESVLGSEWTQFGSDISAAGMVDLSGFKGKLLRIRTSAYTSGTPDVKIYGRREMVGGREKGDVRAIAVPASVAAGAALDAGDMEDAVRLSLTGTFVATVQWQESIDGTVWVNVGSAQTAPGVVVVAKRTRMLRANTTAFTSGTPVGRMYGRADRKPV